VQFVHALSQLQRQHKEKSARSLPPHKLTKLALRAPQVQGQIFKISYLRQRPGPGRVGAASTAIIRPLAHWRNQTCGGFLREPPPFRRLSHTLSFSHTTPAAVSFLTSLLLLRLLISFRSQRAFLRRIRTPRVVIVTPGAALTPIHT
jgi:hypothetical protein